MQMSGRGNVLEEPPRNAGPPFASARNSASERSFEPGSRAATIDRPPTHGDVSFMQALLLRLARHLPPPASYYATPTRVLVLVQFLKFGTVGTLGWIADTATVY